MSAPPVDLDIIDHCCCRSRTGRDGACHYRCRMRRRSALQHLSDLNITVAIGLERRIVSPGPPDPCQPQRRSTLAAPTTTTESP